MEKASSHTKYGTYPNTQLPQELPPPLGVRRPELTLFEKLKIASLIIAWYALNVLYNIDNKLTLNMLPLPWTVSTAELLIGWVFFISSWAMKITPAPTCHSFEAFFYYIVPQGIFHLCVHIGAIISMGLGAVSFTHIVKAGEPVVTASLGALILQDFLSWQTYLTLIPVVGGVAVASIKELSFTWLSFWCAMLSNLGSSGRAIYAKKVMSDTTLVGKNLTPSNQYALLTIVATIVSLPLALFFEGSSIAAVWAEATGPESPFSGKDILIKLFSTSVWYYSYNQMAFFCLEKVNPTTHAVANALKRVVIVVSSVLFFRTPLTPIGIAGSSVAILGTFLYSLSKTKYN